jgi:DNA-binding SARP family transcriptional activator
MQWAILGSLEVKSGDRPVDLGGPKQRAVLAFLLVHVNEVVALDRLIDGLWGETPPARATATLQVFISNLRRALEPERPPRAPATVLLTRPPGYLLRLATSDLDAARFEALAEEGRRHLLRGDAVAAHAALTDALALWRGPALAEFAD